ncbi:hypothetical protein [Micromonospora sp. ATA51]|uniref:hypothetical protein n=1 Tax=Micromonospora sp. ATA51 TaxID=2806098 RepID=UPI001EE4ABE0|nr:hypothetical protein [Micromonospora sp. ATA51]
MIELGELRHGDEVEPPPGPRRPASPSARLVALLCAALLGLAGSAAAPGRRRPCRCPPRSAGFLVLADRLVVADGPGTVGRSGRLVTGHRLPAGSRCGGSSCPPATTRSASPRWPARCW